MYVRTDVDHDLEEAVECKEFVDDEGREARCLIVYDEDSFNPREDATPLGTMVCWHRRYKLGDEQPSCDPAEYEFPEDCIKLPLYLYDHSGITMSTSDFGDRWDSGQVGWIYCTKALFRSETGYSDRELFEDGKAQEILRNEVEEYDRWLRGDVYGYKIQHKAALGDDFEWVEDDSCWGFYCDPKDVFAEVGI